MTELELKRKNRKLTKGLRDLTDTVSRFLAVLDVEMQKPSNEERGRKIALLSNTLDMANDAILRFTLDQSFQSINARKQKMLRTVTTSKKRAERDSK